MPYMNIEKTWQTVSTSSDDTLKIAERFGRNCKGGEVFFIASDLGGGKTTFTKGLAVGLGSDDIVSSPTFMVNRIYDCRDGMQLHHFDFYRLSEGGMVAHELKEVLEDPKNIIVVEWGDIVAGTLPGEYVRIDIARDAAGEDVRQLNFNVPSRFDYLLEGVA